MDMKKFIKKDESFICENCGYKVNPLKYTSRNHCPMCLCSKHVDINPGDRKNNCKGLQDPIDVEKFRHTYKIIYQCKKCNVISKNVMALDDKMDLVIMIYSKQI